MERTIDYWYQRKVADENAEEWKKLTVLEKEIIYNLGNERVLVCQYYHSKADKRWVTVKGFIVEEKPDSVYGISREYYPGEKESITDLVLNDGSLEGIIGFDEGGRKT